jgi:hypothetical protein
MDIKKLINRKNSREWAKANDSANAKSYREAFVNRFGGIFEKMGAIWFWKDKAPQIEEQPTKLWIFHKADGGTFMVQNFMEFCRMHDLSKSAMYELMAGKRKSHKGFVKVEKLV